MTRIFIAIVIPNELHSWLSNTQGQITGMGNYDLVALESLHIPLNYLGRVDDTKLASIQKKLRRIAATTRKFDISFPHLAALYKRKEPSPVFLSPEPITTLIELYESIANHALDLQIPQPGKYEPMLVLAHTQKSDPETTKILVEQINDLAYAPPPPFTVNALRLFKITSTKKGEHHQRLMDVLLQ